MRASPQPRLQPPGTGRLLPADTASHCQAPPWERLHFQGGGTRCRHHTGRTTSPGNLSEGAGMGPAARPPPRHTPIANKLNAALPTALNLAWELITCPCWEGKAPTGGPAAPPGLCQAAIRPRVCTAAAGCGSLPGTKARAPSQARAQQGCRAPGMPKSAASLEAAGHRLYGMPFLVSQRAVTARSTLSLTGDGWHRHRATPRHGTARHGSAQGKEAAGAFPQDVAPGGARHGRCHLRSHFLRQHPRGHSERGGARSRARLRPLHPRDAPGAARRRRRRRGGPGLHQPPRGGCSAAPPRHMPVENYRRPPLYSTGPGLPGPRRPRPHRRERHRAAPLGPCARSATDAGAPRIPAPPPAPPRCAPPHPGVPFPVPPPRCRAEPGSRWRCSPLPCPCRRPPAPPAAPSGSPVAPRPPGRRR